MPRFAILLPLAVALIALPARGETPAPSAPNATAGLANPAAVFCAERGGIYRITKAADGSQAGACTVDGETHDAWDYFRKNAPKAQ